MRRAFLAVACLLALLVAACDDDAGGDANGAVVPGPGPAKVKVDTPELVALKKQVGMADCRPGPGGGALPAVTLP